MCKSRSFVSETNEKRLSSVRFFDIISNHIFANFSNRLSHLTERDTTIGDYHRSEARRRWRTRITSRKFIEILSAVNVINRYKCISYHNRSVYNNITTVPPIWFIVVTRQVRWSEKYGVVKKTLRRGVQYSWLRLVWSEWVKAIVCPSS